jgi:Tol biopolymer transport system component
MRSRTFASLILVALIGAALSASATIASHGEGAQNSDPISGDWDVSFTLQGTTVQGKFKLKLDGDKVTGTAESEHTGPGTLSKGSWTDNKLSFTLDFKTHESIVVTGALQDGKLLGEFRTEGMQGTWEAKRNIAPMVQGTARPTPPPLVNGAQPVVSPDGARIAFLSNRGGSEDLFVINADGTGETQLTHTPEAETGLQWSADGMQIVFSVLTNDTSRLYGIDKYGKNQHEIASLPGRTPMLAPEGERVVYMAGTWTATRLMVSALDGSGAKQINDGSSIAWNNHWSPDGKRIAFTGQNDPKSELAVFVMNADGSNRRQVTHIAPEEGGAQWPVWAPNGRQLAVQVNSRLHRGSAHIWIVDAATGEARKLAAHDQTYLDETPYWFPDGQRIAFQSNRTGRMEVWVMNADGSGQRQVTGAR